MSGSVSTLADYMLGSLCLDHSHHRADHSGQNFTLLFNKAMCQIDQK